MLFAFRVMVIEAVLRLNDAQHGPPPPVRHARRGQRRPPALARACPASRRTQRAAHHRTHRRVQHLAAGQLPACQQLQRPAAGAP